MTPGRDVPSLPRWLPAALWSAATVAVASLVGRFWIPLDEGTLAQSAERVLGGELPHVDFADPYTGLNAMVGALAFRLFGVSLASLRIPLVIGFAAWLPAVWLVARRSAPPWTALAATTLAGLGSVLAYPAAMPTWFALFAVTWGLVFLHASLDGGGRSWLVAAGAAAGVSVLFKVVGLYFLAASLLAVAWRRGASTPLSRSIAIAGCGGFLLALMRLLAPAAGLGAAGHFFVPAVALCLAVVARGWRAPVSQGATPAALLSDGLALLGGLSVPIAVFLVPYAVRGGVSAWVEGVFLRPGLRFESAASAPAAAWTLLTGAAAVGLLVIASRLGETARRRTAIALAALLALGLALDDVWDGAVLGGLWYALRTFTPALAIWGAWRLSTPEAPRDAATFATLSTAVLWSLVQFPYAAPAYFFYVAPLTVLATVAVLGAGPVGHRRPGAVRYGPVLAVVAATFAYLGAGYAYGVARSGERPLDLERGGILVSSEDADRYAALVQAIWAHVGPGSLWAGPDAPEIYFLSGLPNRTPILYEFLTTPETEEPLALSDPAVSVAVVNTRPLFSEPLGADVLRRLSERFPQSREEGPWLIRWRNP